MSNDKRLAYAIVSHFNDQLKRGVVTGDPAESLEGQLSLIFLFIEAIKYVGEKCILISRFVFVCPRVFTRSIYMYISKRDTKK